MRVMSALKFSVRTSSRSVVRFLLAQTICQLDQDYDSFFLTLDLTVFLQATLANASVLLSVSVYYFIYASTLHGKKSAKPMNVLLKS